MTNSQHAFDRVFAAYTLNQEARFSSTYSTEDIAMIMQTIRDRLAGKVDDLSWVKFLRMLEATAKTK